MSKMLVIILAMMVLICALGVMDCYGFTTNPAVVVNPESFWEKAFDWLKSFFEVIDID